MFKDTQEALDWLYSTQLFGIKLGLKGMGRLLDACQLLPLPAGTQLIHVAGTNGKGSTCAMIERVAREHGLCTGMFTSPHLICFHERMRVNGQLIEDADLCRLLNIIKGIITQYDLTPTFFELATALALLHFKEQGCQLIILETGMGGRLDATNALPKDLAVITPIGLDHTQYLGDTLALVAGEKAGIIQAGKPTVCAQQEVAAAKVIEARCAQLGSSLQMVVPDCSYALSLHGVHQPANAALALAALQMLPAFCMQAHLTARALMEVHWEGRYEHVQLAGKELIVDGAHNAHAMQALVASYRAQVPDGQLHCIFAAAADKDLGPMLRLLAPLVEAWILPPLSSPRIMPAGEMSAAIAPYSTAPCQLCDSLTQALESAPKGQACLVCGSLFLVGELKALLQEQDYRSTAQ